MAGTGPTDLYDVCALFLATSVEALNTIPDSSPGLEGAPERAFVSPGRPALEGCDQLTVHAQNVLDAQTGRGGLNDCKRNVQGKRNHVRLVVTIDRCVADSRQGQQNLTQPYLVDDLDAAAQQCNADVWAIWNHLFNAWRSGEFLTICEELCFEGATALPEEGGRAGWTLTFRVNLDGYGEWQFS